MDIEALYDEWSPCLLPYMITITRDRHKAEDALQELFVNLVRSQPRMEDPAVYLFRAARNEAIRMSRRRPECSLASLELLSSEDPTDSAEVADALDSLPPEQAEVVVLHALQGRTFREVGAILGIPQDTAASRYRYALAKLQERLG